HRCNYLAAEMLPDLRMLFLSNPILVDEHDLSATCYAADLRNSDTSNLPGNALTSLCREEQFVIFSTMQRSTKVYLPSRPSDDCLGDRFFQNFCTHAAFFADVR